MFSILFSKIDFEKKKISQRLITNNFKNNFNLSLACGTDSLRPQTPRCLPGFKLE